jgi:hypothetical protein
MVFKLGVRDVTILVTGGDDCHRSAVKFEAPKESPLESGITKNELLRIGKVWNEK